MADTTGSGSDGVVIDEEGPVVRVTLARPEKLNPFDDHVRVVLAELLHQLEDRPDIRVVVVAGQGRAFSAGADLRKTAYPPVTGDWATRRHRTGTWQRLLEQFDRVPQATSPASTATSSAAPRCSPRATSASRPTTPSCASPRWRSASRSPGPVSRCWSARSGCRSPATG